ncbi:AraC family transcriptional regulator [Acrocarpospora pleiomorpha]|uniref:AraC family transcriptional regulator n=1 Tax=Acrocarpospora pleiomorpha TaxID=90975 RepID=A0A5M3XG77_9ACTN|nr:AraC family transcriptional regulator [Acrocarpospora pleiomorpha]
MLVVSTSDLDHARSVGAQAFFRHRLSMTETRAIRMRLRACAFGSDITVGRIGYGAPVRLDCGRLETGYQINIPLSGRIRSRCGDQRLAASPKVAAVYTPDPPSAIELWSADCVQIGVRFSRAMLERTLAELLNHPVRRAIAFDHAFDLADGCRRSWAALARSVLDLGAALPAPGRARLMEPVIRTIVTSFLHAARHEYREELDAERPVLASGLLRRATREIEEHLDEPLDLAALAVSCGVSVRTLQDQFARQLGVTPTAYRRQLALQHAHRDLVRADPAHTTVAEIACRWGFYHLGRFAREYRDRFGVTPVDTLRAS